MASTMPPEPSPSSPLIRSGTPSQPIRPLRSALLLETLHIAQRCGRCSLPLQNGGYTACGLQHGQQYPQHCPIVSVGEENRNHLKTTFRALKLYMLSPRDLVDTMRAKHGVATSDDVSRLRDPLSRALSDVIVGPDWPHGFLPVGQPASDTVRPRVNRLQLFQALS